MDKKALKEQYKSTKPDMGVFIIQSIKEHSCLVIATGNLTGAMNSARFQLDFGSYPDKVLQEWWKRDGAAGFNIRVLETLPYGQDETKQDYSEELSIMKLLWEERLSAEGMRCLAR
jgi:hypothetical protein